MGGAWPRHRISPVRWPLFKRQLLTCPGASLRPHRHAGRPTGYQACIPKAHEDPVVGGVERDQSAPLHEDPERRGEVGVDLRPHAAPRVRETDAGRSTRNTRQRQSFMLLESPDGPAVGSLEPPCTGRKGQRRPSSHAAEGLPAAHRSPPAPRRERPWPRAGNSGQVWGKSRERI